MAGLIRSVARELVSPALQFIQLREDLQTLKLQLGRLQTGQMLASQPESLRQAEYRVFSQFGEDGIIQFLLSRVGQVPQTFVEFGVENYSEANTLFLLLNDNWRGLVIDGSKDAMSSLRKKSLYWRHDLTAVGAFIDRDNINALISGAGFSGEIGLLSVDIDGNDYWVWERIDVVNPVIVIAEYNSVFGDRAAVSVPYDPSFRRTEAHYSNLFWGCSLAALCHLAKRKGYAFVGTNSAGNNAFFVRNDRRGGLPDLTPSEGYTASRFRESRDREGALTFLSGAERRTPIAHLKVVDVVTGNALTVGSLDQVPGYGDQGSSASCP